MFMSICIKKLVLKLTLPLLEQKAISLCHQYRGRQACTFGWPTSNSYLEFPNRQTKNKGRQVHLIGYSAV